MPPVSALLEAVRADPFNRGLRAVYGDALLSVGDPRGEFIALQLAGHAAGEKRASSLLRKNFDLWLGPLLPFVIKSSVRFVDGFPGAAKLRLRSPEAVRAAEASEDWFSFTELSFETQREAHSACSFLSHHMRSLKRVTGVGPDGLQSLARLSTLPPLEVFGLEAERTSSRWFEVFARLGRLKTLRVANWHAGAAELESLWSQLPPRLMRLSVDAARVAPAEARTLLERAPPALEQVVLGPATWVRTEGGWSGRGSAFG